VWEVVTVANRPLTEADRDQVRELHAQGLTRNAIATEIGRSAATVTKIAGQLGLSFDRAVTQAATAAKVADARLRRRGIIERLYAQAEKQLERLECGQHKMAEVSMGSVVHYTVDEPPAADVHRLMGAINAAATGAVKLEQVDADSGATDARSMVSALAAGLQVAYEQMQGAPDDSAD
jgi:hypothetical protein